MSRNFKSEYTGFGRQILSEFMSQDQLKELDNKYNQAKLNRNVRLATNKLNNNIMETNETRLIKAKKLLNEMVTNWDEKEVVEYSAKMSFDELVSELNAITIKATNVPENYFNGGWTDENIELLAKFQNYEQGTDIDLVGKSREELEEAIMENGNIGDTEAKKIFENDTFLIYVSIDSSTEVLNCIHKKHLNNSQVFEIN